MAIIRLSEDQLIQACTKYKQLCESKDILRPDFWHFCGWIGETDAAISAIIKYGGRGGTAQAESGAGATGSDSNANAADSGANATSSNTDSGANAKNMIAEAAKYGRAAEELRRLCTYIRGQYSVAPGWSGASTSKALFNQRQDFDGCALSDKVEAKTTGEISVKLIGNFGGVDNPFA